MAANIRDLKVWQEAVALAAEVVRTSRQGARRETKVVTDQLMLTALAAAGTIADGYGRYTATEQRQLYRSAKRELLRLETQLAVARQADLISAQTHADLVNRVQSQRSVLDQKFERSVQQNKHQKEILEKKFEEARKRANADPNVRPPNPFDNE
jgi:four helix bundle protein